VCRWVYAPHTLLTQYVEKYGIDCQGVEGEKYGTDCQGVEGEKYGTDCQGVEGDSGIKDCSLCAEAYSTGRFLSHSQSLVLSREYVSDR